MRDTWTAVRKSFEEIISLSLDVFTSDKPKGWRRTVLLMVTCSLWSLLLCSLLLLYLLFTLDYKLMVAGGIAGCFVVLLTFALFLSKRLRCLGTLFVVSIFMKKSRNLLLTAGTSLVVLKNIRNTLENLTLLVRSMICNLKMKKASIIAPFGNYIRMLEWIGNILKGVTDLGLVNLDSKLDVSPRIESEHFNVKLKDAEKKLNETVKYAQALIETISSVTSKMLPAISFLVLMMFITLHIKRYCNNMKYENRFISSRFVLFDEKQKAEGKPHVLPLTEVEGKRYFFIPSARPNAKEGKAVLKFGAPVLSHFIAWIIAITVDALLYCFVDIVTKKLSALEPFHVPLIISFKGISTLIGIPFDEKSQEVDFSFSVTLFEEQCLPEPKLLLYNSVFPLSIILLALIIMALIASKVSQLRLIVCERFFTSAGHARVEYLHRKILKKRSKMRTERSEFSLKSLIAKPHFWCPIIFKANNDPQRTGNMTPKV